jgi:hypothetical protein
MPGCHDVIRNGWNGFLVPPRAPQPLAERILDLLRDRARAETMGVRAANFARHEFNLELTVARYSAVYEGLLNGINPQRLQSVDDDPTEFERDRRSAVRQLAAMSDSSKRVPAASYRSSGSSQLRPEP